VAPGELYDKPNPFEARVAEDIERKRGEEPQRTVRT
jgi:hypothetical protein